MEKNTVTVGYILWVIKHRWIVLVTTFVVVVGLGFGAQHLGLNQNYRVFFGKDNPDLLAFEAIEDIYTKNDNILFVMRSKQGDGFNAKSLQAVRELTKEAWQIPHSTRVDSITNFQHTWAKGDELIVEDLVGEGPITEGVVERARRISLKEPFLNGKLISPDWTTTGVNVRIQLPGKSPFELSKTVAFSRQLRDRFKQKYPNLDIKLTGIAALNNAFAEAPLIDAPNVIPVMFGVFALVMVAFLRSFLGTVAALTLVSLSAIVTLGVAGFLGTLLDPASAAAPIIILTLAVADSIHILVTFFEGLQGGLNRREAIIESFRVNAQPVFLTSITTAVGFLSLNFSDSPPFRLLGNITAFGVMVAWVFSMTFLPAALAVLPFRVPSKSSLKVSLFERLGKFVTKRHKGIAIAFVSITLVLLGAMATLKVDDRFHEYFSESLPIRSATDFSLKHLTGIYQASYSLDAGESGGVSDPEYLSKVASFVDWLRTRPEVAHVNSFSDTMKRLNKNMHGDDLRYYRLPERRELGAQYLLLYEMSLPYGLDVNDQINIDKSALRVDVTYGDVNLSVIEKSVAESQQWLATYGTEAMKSARGAGPALMFASITRRNINSMLVGTSVGFGIISAILAVALLSFRMGVISLIPNVLPAAMAFGVWALVVGEVGFAVSIVAGLSIGIIVDDTVHFLSKYQRARRELGMSAQEAVHYAFKMVGSAIVGTSIIVSAGFAMLGLSTFRVTAYMGYLTSIAIIAALVTDLFLLPSLLCCFFAKSGKTKMRDTFSRSDESTLIQTRGLQ